MTPIEEKKTLLAILGITDGKSDQTVDIALKTAEEIICNYCNLSASPTELGYTKVAMSAQIFRESGNGSVEKSGDIKALTEGDVSVTFEASQNRFLNDFKGQLDTYKKVRW